MDDIEKEPVLVVPPQLTKSSYATLLSLEYVPQKWHLEGRYGSRTHKIEHENKIGIPLLRSTDKIQYLESVLKRRSDASQSTDGQQPTNLKKCADHCNDALFDLLTTPGVDLVFKTPVPSNRIPKEEIFDATIHPERMPDFFKNNLGICNEIKKGKILRPSHSPAFTFCELFAGIGGFGIALEALGGKCIFASEIYEPSRAIYRANLDTSRLPNSEISGNIWNVRTEDIPCHDLLVGGFPCQPFSSLGDQPGLHDLKKNSGRKRGLENTVDKGGGRGHLFTQIVRVLRDVQPNAFLLENVPGLITTQGGNALRTIISSLEAVGYEVSYEICSSRGLTAQSRKRLYIVGIKLNSIKEREENCTFQFPFIPDLKIRAADVLHTQEELNTSFTATGIPSHLAQHYNNDKTPASMFQLTDAQMTQLRTRSKSWKPAKLAWDDKTFDTIDSHYGITVGKGNSQLVPNSSPHHPRRLTPRECARIMGFSDSFKLGKFRSDKKSSSQLNVNSPFNGFIKEQYFMLGNAVCPPVITVLAGSILHCIPATQGKNVDWIERGLRTGIKLAYDSVTPKNIRDLEHLITNSY